MKLAIAFGVLVVLCVGYVRWKDQNEAQVCVPTTQICTPTTTRARR